MPAVKMNMIECSDPHSSRRLADLRARLSAQGDVVSTKGKELTQRVFGEPLPPAKVVERVCGDVRSRGLQALFHYTEQFDGVRLDRSTLRVSHEELAEAHAAAEPRFLELIGRVRRNILAFQLGLLHADAVLSAPDVHELRLRYRPMRRVGICIPGGAAAYPSTLLMTVCPAQAAGVGELAVVMPPGPFGASNRDLLATCQELGIMEVYRVGGAQGVAALAYGVDGLPPVDMIVGPGNIFVTLAKRYVFGQVAIDMLAGPTELVVIADETAVPDVVAADLIAQAEHSPGASILISWQKPLLDAVGNALESQLRKLSRGDLARDSLESFGAFVLARDEAEALTCANQIAPEHLQIVTAQPERMADKIDNAGAIFMGPYTPVALGDYVAGPSHVLPTGGTARFASGLTANDFLRRTSILSFSKMGLTRMAEDIRDLAEKEGLTAHAASVQIRLSQSEESNRDGPVKRNKGRQPQAST